MPDYVIGQKIPVSCRVYFNSICNTIHSFDFVGAITGIKFILFMGIELPLKVSFHLN